VTTPAPAPAPAPVDSTKLIQYAVATYMNNPAAGIPSDKLKDELEKNPNTYFVLDIRKTVDYAKATR